MIWTRHFDEHTAEQGRYDAIITRTHTCPLSHIPKSARWTLDITGPWCLYRCFPTIKAAKAAAERVIAALKEEE